MITFLAPAARCLPAASRVRNRPVDSTTMSTPRSPHGKPAGSRSDSTRIESSSMRRKSPSTFTSPWYRPCTES